MNKETYESLKKVIREVKTLNRIKFGFYSEKSNCYEDMKQVENWIDEVAKENDVEAEHRSMVNESE